MTERQEALSTQEWSPGQAFVYGEAGPVEYFARWATFEETEYYPPTSGRYFRSQCGGIRNTNHCRRLAYIRDPAE